MTPFELCLTSLVLACLGAWLLARHAGRLGLVDYPNERSSHSAPTATAGGVGILVAFVVVSALVSVPAALWVPAMLVGLLGLATDVRDIAPGARLAFEAIAGAAVVVGAVTHAGIQVTGLSLILLVACGVLYLAGSANFYNFMDGIDGMAAISGVVAFGLIAAHGAGGDSSLTLLAASISLACAGFLPLNWPSARVFMGDVGSLLLGFSFSGVVVWLSTDLLEFVCLASFLFPFYADELTTMAIRMRRREELVRPHRQHLYQILANEKGIAHWRISGCYGLAQLAIGLGVLAIIERGLISVLLLVGCAFGLFTALSLLIRRNVATANRGSR